MSVTITAIISAATIEIQIPSILQIRGNKRTAAIWKTSVLKNDIKADVKPSLSAVKNEEPKIAIPAKRNENE